mgnify:CR=1 FL=1
MQTLFESSRYLVTAGGDPSLQPVVTFHPRRDVPGIERHRNKPWMRKPIEQAGYRWIAVTTEQNDWYQHSDMDEAVQAISRFLGGVQPLVFGFSMGGLAAWQYADALNALAWVGVTPNYNAQPHQSPDDRVLDERKRVQWRELPAVPTGGHIILDPMVSADAWHAKSLAREASVTIHPYPKAGHSCLVTFTKEGRLAERLAYHFDWALSSHKLAA